MKPVEHGERLIDEALEETFPASDSISPAVGTDRDGPANPDGIEQLDASIAAARENLRQLVEQASTYSGAADEDLSAERIAEQEQRLEELKRQRAQLGPDDF